MRAPVAAGLLPTTLAIASLIVAPASAGLMHARAQVGAGIHSQYAGHNNCANAYQSTGSCWVSAKECKGTNYVNKAVACGNKGSGHAHHHGGNSPQELQASLEGSSLPPLPQPPTMLPGTSGNNAFARQTYETVGALGDSLRVTFDSESSFVQVDLNMLPPGQPYYNDIVIEVSGETSVVSLTGARGIPVTHSVSGRFAGQSFTVTQVPGTEIYYLKFNGPITFDVPGDIENTDVGIASNGCPGTGPCPLSGNNPIPGASSLGLVLASLLTLAFGVFFLRNRRGRHTFAA